MNPQDRKNSMFGMMVESAFKKADTDKSGFIEFDELTQVCKQFHKEMKLPEPTQQDINNTLKELDLNSDGKVSLEEFGALIRKLIASKKK